MDKNSELEVGRQEARVSSDVETLRRAVLDNLVRLQARYPDIAVPHDWYMALAATVRDRMLERWVKTAGTYADKDVKVVCYLSAEFLIGPQLGSNLLALGIEANAREAMASLGQDLDALAQLEEEPGLGNGGLGRLAACYLDSLATLEIPAIGYGIRYEFGIFDQEIRNGAQVEVTDKWLEHGNPWEIAHPDEHVCVNFGGRTESFTDDDGRYAVRWIPTHQVKGIPYDTPVLGYGAKTCNTLRLWKSEAVESFDLGDFNIGNYYGAVQDKVLSESLCKVLYPNDEPEIGRRLRLAQQYFFVSCSLQHVLRLMDRRGGPLKCLPEICAIQMNDTHPSIAVAELMRLLVDERGLGWDDAWAITRRTLAYTNHTLLPEALETWDLPLFAALLPRLLEIIYEINQRFLEEVRAIHRCNDEQVARVSLIDEVGDKRVRMAHLATVGSHLINGVAALHSKLLRETVLRDFAELWPQRFTSVTNGVSPRRFLALSNPGLARLLDDTVGEGWVTDLTKLRALEGVVDDSAFQDRWRAVKKANKVALAHRIRERTGITVDPTSLFDVQVKRIHEYKRQLLNLLHVIALYDRLRRDPGLATVPRCVIFGGKAAPGYFMAKLIIRLINGVAAVVNDDPLVAGRLKVVFLADFNVKNAQAIYPAADLSEQISTAGREASGTGNMKFMLNGALTIGTLDGANVEIIEEAGVDNFFSFGLTVDGVERTWREGYDPQPLVEADPSLAASLRLIAEGTFSGGDCDLFRPIVDNLAFSDPFLVLADYADYIECQAKVDASWSDPQRWTQMSILNTARAGKFSSDRAIREYAQHIWNARSVSIPLR